MHDIYWVVTANTNSYKIYHYDRNKKEEFIPLFEDSDPDAKKSDAELTSGHPGHYMASSARGTYSSHADPKTDEIDGLIKKLVDECETGRVNNQYNKIILLAPPRVNGIFSKHMNKDLGRLLLNSAKQDFTHLEPKKLLEFIHKNWLDLHNNIAEK